MSDIALTIVARAAFFAASHRLVTSLKPALHQISEPDDPAAADTPDVELAQPTFKVSSKGLSKLSTVLFAASFAEACTCLGIVVANEFGAHSRQLTVSLYILLCLVLLALPYKQCLLFTYSTKSTLSLTAHLAIAIVPYTAYVFLFSLIPYFDENPSWLDLVIGRLVFLGVFILGGLSGFGAVRTAWSFYQMWRSSDAPNDEAILQTERSLGRLRQDIVDHQPQKRSWLGGSEIDGLKAVERQTMRQLALMKEQRARQVFASSLGGKLYGVVGRIFALYCCARVLMCIPSLFVQKSNGDWISYLLVKLLDQLPLTIDVLLWSRAVSLGFTGLIILSSLAQVLRSLTRALKLTSAAGSSFLLLVLAELFATYIISLLVQIRSSITDEQHLLAALPDFRHFGRLFDVAFLISALGTFVYKFIRH